MADSEPDEKTGPRKGLWALMGQKRDEATQPAEGPEPATSVPLEPTGESPIPTEETQASTSAKPSGRPKGLWSLMHQADSATTSADPPLDRLSAEESIGSETRAAFEGPIKGADKRLRQLQRADDTTEQLESQSGEFHTAADPVDVEVDSDSTGSANVARNHPHTAFPVTSDWVAPTAAPVIPRTGTARSAMWSFVLGGLSLPISLIAILPAAWARIPASVCGFSALIFGILAISEIKRSRKNLRGNTVAYSGIVMGLVGMFVGPMVYSPLDLYGKSCDWHTNGHLQQIGLATEAYYQEHAGYPTGGIFREVKQAEFEPLHGWMTLILPHLPEGAALGPKIEFAKPYFDPINLPVMEQRIPSFMAAGGTQALIQGKFGPAHFAGLGGSVLLADETTAHAGVFDINSDVTRDDIPDGLSNTMVAGEIGSEYPAWGEPRNWRQIGKGLNRDLLGFGNARHSGALFLMADGSVKYFPNQTDPKVLQALSTRDGGEGF